MSVHASKPNHCDAAVIDVGSNSVRLVLYRLVGRAIWAVYNEKILAGLGQDLATTGRLSPAGVSATLLALRRFRALIESSTPAHVFATATAAVRQATDGDAFVARVAHETGLALRVLNGDEEARISAQGVLAGDPDATGVVADLGGASLELIRINGAKLGGGVTLPLGPFALTKGQRSDPASARAIIDKHLESIGDVFATDTLNAVGGAWRNLAMVQMKLSGYPLAIIHQYEIGRRELLSATRFIAQQSRESLERIEGLTKRRVDVMPYAAVMLESLVERLGIQRVRLSAYGLREGLVWQALPSGCRALNPLVAGCAALAGRPADAEALGQALEIWARAALAKLDPLFEGRDGILNAAVCRAVDLGSQLHPDHRAELVFQNLLRAPLAGVSHAERAFIAGAAFSRYAPGRTPPETELANRLLTAGQKRRARILGAMLRLGCDLSGRGPDLLARTRLEITSKDVVLSSDADWAPLLMGEQALKRGQILAGLLDRSFKTQVLARAEVDLATARG